VVQELTKQVKLLSSANREIVDAVIGYHDAVKMVARMPNYQEVIDGYNQQNEQLWDRYNLCKSLLELGIQQQERLATINELKVQMAADLEKQEMLQKYIMDASSYYTQSVTKTASEYLKQINGRYRSISLMENEFFVTVQQEDLAVNMIPILQLSSGERTMCAIALLFAIHNLMVPELPLLFDETFRALDHENLLQVQKFLRNQSAQIFVITHDQQWEEF
jgi:DNA repair exonuclease SbcCD ATPase subunit